MMLRPLTGSESGICRHSAVVGWGRGPKARPGSSRTTTAFGSSGRSAAVGHTQSRRPEAKGLPFAGPHAFPVLILDGADPCGFGDVRTKNGGKRLEIARGVHGACVG